MLSSDICRCHDHDCAERFECLRYIEREGGQQHERTPHAQSMRVDWNGCGYKIESEREVSDGE